MLDIEKIFYNDSNIFTIFVVEQRFVVGRGHEYLGKFINTQHFFDSEKKAKQFYKKIVDKIQGSVTHVADSISSIITGNYVTSIAEIITALCKLFTVTEHQAAGPHVVDPIIIQEGAVTKRSLNKIINIHKDSVLRPAIIILLKDNDFERAKELLSDCPNGSAITAKRLHIRLLTAEQMTSTLLLMLILNSVTVPVQTQNWKS